MPDNAPEKLPDKLADKHPGGLNAPLDAPFGPPLDAPLDASYQRRKPVRLPQLDLLRGFAVLLVIARHLTIGYADAGRMGPLAKIAFDFGWTGVDLFFTLSGFLVGGLLFKEWRERGRLDVRRFLIRRGFKIWPAYFIYIGVLAGIYLVENSFGSPRQAFAVLLPNFLHLQSYLASPLLHTWSLSVEEHFYLALPLILLLSANRDAAANPWPRAARTLLLAGVVISGLLVCTHFALRTFLPLESLPEGIRVSVRPYLHARFLWLLGLQLFALVSLFVLMPLLWKSDRRDFPSLPITAAGVCILCLAFRAGTYWLSKPLEIDWTFIFFATHLRIDSLFFGVLLGYWYHFHQAGFERMAAHRNLLCVAGAALVVTVIYLPSPLVSPYFGLGFTLLYLGYGCLLVAVVSTPLGSGWLGKLMGSPPARWIAFIGYYSYSIYLWHINPIRVKADQWLFAHLGDSLPAELRWMVLTVVSVSATILLGMLMATLIEQRFLRLRDRMFPARTGALALHPASPTE